MFQSIQSSDLQLNEKYKIVSSYEYTGHFKETFSFLPNGQLFIMFDKLYNVTNEENCFGNSFFCNTTNFYKFVSKQPIWNMERRSVNMIVRRLIGDDHFEW